jgi:hypothetical protein
LVFSSFSSEICISVSLAYVDDRGKMGEDVGLEVVDLPFFFDFVDGRWRILVQDNTGTSPGRRAMATCASLRALGMFIDS